MRIFIKKIIRRLAKNRPLLPDNEKEVVYLPKDGHKVSVETALNSRCCSDHDNDPELFHWGMFDASRKLSEETIGTLANHARCYQLTRSRPEIRRTANILTFLVDGRLSGLQQKWAMVESGMQQQACALACAALGIGMVFKSMSDCGPLLSADELATMRIMVDAMKPSYDGSYWSNQPPAGRKPWLPGNLPDPMRGGNIPLLATLSSVQINHNGYQSLTDQAIGQLLWAARGRTPHLYKSRPWGMTIPTNRGEQSNSSVYLLRDGGSFRYVNQAKDRPTHSMEPSRLLSHEARERLIRCFPPSQSMIVLATHDKSEVALWEIGYQLLNILVQASALDLSYQAFLLDHEQLEIDISKMESDPIAAVCLA